MLYLMIHELYLLILMEVFHFNFIVMNDGHLLAPRAEFPENTGQDCTNFLVSLSNLKI